MTTYTDIGTALACAALDVVTETAENYGGDDLCAPAWKGHVAGAAVPTVDACDGMVWVRVASQLPTDGSGGPIGAQRFDSDVQAWVISIEIGHLWCHPVIEADGSSPDGEDWASCAARDGQWRMIVCQAAATFRQSTTGNLRAAIIGQSVSPWAPIGPDGGYSGGLIVASVIVGALAICD